MNLYIDIDGVLLGKTSRNSPDTILAKYAKEFLEFSLENFDCYWLTTHCKNTESSKVIKYLSPYIDDNIQKLLLEIKPTKWDTLKTEAIDLESDFYWIDDAPLYSEKEELKRYCVFDRWIEVSTRKYPDDSLKVIKILSLKVIGNKND